MTAQQWLWRWLVIAGVLSTLVASNAFAGSGARQWNLDWKDCGDGYECSTLDVPRDYGRSDGAKFNLAIIRLPAQDQAHRLGALFVNFGGPGGTTVDTIHAIGRDLFGAVNDRFDIVGVDPRGVGQPSHRSTARSTRRRRGSTPSRSRRRSTFRSRT